jgi:crotonobetainyl-CoA:carnitine CoA-transferase CaiB-like acyl-CoA transferase
MGHKRPGVRLNPPRLGEHSSVLLHELGYDARAIQALQKNQIIAGDGHDPDKVK